MNGLRSRFGIALFCLVAGLLWAAPLSGSAAGAATNAVELLPLWEVGLFGGVARFPQYPAADEYNVYYLPLPYLILRYKVLQSDREGLRGIFFKTAYFQTDLSVSGYPPVSDDNQARAGMPELDPTLEIGPALKWFPCKRFATKAFYLQAALRPVTVVELDDNWDLVYQGVHGGLSLVYNDRALWGDKRWSGGASASVDYGDRRYYGYYFDVTESYATAARPEYDAGSGYGGWGLSANLVRKITARWSLGLYAKWNNYAGAVFADSPLARSDNTFTLGAAIIGTLAESARRVHYEMSQ